MPPSAKWADLRTRTLTALAMGAVGALAIWAGGAPFALLVAVICGAVVWELLRMLDAPALALPLAVLAGGGLLAALALPTVLALGLLLVPLAVGALRLGAGRVIFVAFTLLVLLAGHGLIQLRTEAGLLWLLWLVLVVVATDVLGYLAGRTLGGPKFWPKISPKKTWSGTLAGWLGAALVGAGFAAFTQAGVGLVLLSVALSLASQMGDIAESALKRRQGVKDSSALLPGHGGVFDRFDGMLGAAVLLALVSVFAPLGAM